MHSGDANRALYQALPYAVKQAPRLVQSADCTEYATNLKPQWKTQRELRVVYDPGLRQKLPEELAHIAGILFERDSVLSSALSEFKGVEITTPLPILSKGTLVSDLPLMKLYLDSVKSECWCAECSGPSEPHYTTCMWKGALISFSSIVADVLALSLLDCTEPILVYIKGRFGSQKRCAFDETVYDVLAEGKSTLCGVERVVDWALDLIGHDVSSEVAENWVMSSYRDQTFYPRLFETEILERNGVLVLSGAPRVLRHDGQVSKKATAARRERRITFRNLDSIMSRLLGVPVTGLLNLLQGHRIKWQATMEEDGLQVSLLSTAAPATYNPFAVLCAAVQSLYVEACPHAPDAVLTEPDRWATYTAPFHP